METQDDNDSNIDDLSAPEPESIAINNILAGLGDDSEAMVTILKEGPGGYRDQQFLTEITPSEFSLSMLQSEFGGGKFRIHIRENGRLLANKSIKVAPLRMTVTPGENAQSAEIKELASTVKNLAELIARSAMQPPPQQKTTLDMLNELKLMKEVIGSPAPAQATDQLEAALKVFEVADVVNKMKGGAESGGDGMGVLLEAIKSFGPALAQAAAAKNNPVSMMTPAMPVQQMPVQSEMPQPQIGQPAPENIQPLPEEYQMLKFYLSVLRQKAAGNSDPIIYANLILDNLDDDQINELLAPDDWFERLCKIEPSLNQYREWFSELRQITLKALTEEYGEDETAENPVNAVETTQPNAPAPTAKSKPKRNT